jgi:hypothetical protein
MFLETGAPPPLQTRLWAHLGANVAARDWHELGGGRLLPLRTADPQRFLVATPELVEPARRAFVDEPGLEQAYPSNGGAEGELAEVLAAGYPRAFGIFGAHRFHHARNDDMRCVEPQLVVSTGQAVQRLIAEALV